MKDLTDAPIFLIGYRGSGKTTMAQLLAARLGRNWIDADDLVEARAGKTIAAIFAEDGEATFRNWEAQVVAELCGRTQTVIGLGGGAVLREESRRAIQAAGPVVWLTASVETIQERMTADASTASRRPNLTAAGGRIEIEKVLAVRTPIYRACATIVVDTEGKEPSEVADEIVAQLNAIP